jgi:hemolysin-activating ACP:hemolysin acyltransferase
MLFGRKSKDDDAACHAGDVALTNALRDLDQSSLSGTHAAGETSCAPSISRELDAADAQRQMAAARQAAATFGEIVTLFMRSPAYRNLPLGELDALVTPALRVGQVSVATAQAKTTGVVVPVGAVLWACVSPQIADRLAAHVGENIRLDPQEWKSGEIVWVVASVGDGRVLGEMLKQLSKREWAGREVKIVVRPKDGNPTVATFATAS